MPEQITKSLLNDKPNMKQTEKVTPLRKKALTASGANIVTNVDSFIQPPKSINQANSVIDEKRRHEEDARKKREDQGLRVQTEKERRNDANVQTLDHFKTKTERKREQIPLKERVYCNQCNYFVSKEMIHNLRTHVQRKHENKGLAQENIPPHKKEIIRNKINVI